MSWFRRRSRNRPHNRRHVLDVKLSSEQRRHTRLRWMGVAFGTSAVALLLVFVVWRGGDWTLQRLIYQNPAFTVRDIEVETDGVIAPEQLRRWSGVNLDDNLFALDLARVKRDLEYVPLIRFAEVERAFPHTLRIRVVEREPVAQFLFVRSRPGSVSESVAYWLDEDGFVIPQIPLSQRSLPIQTNEWLPVITGVPASDVRPGKRVEATQVLAALRLISQFERSSMAGFADLREVHAGTPDVLIAQTEQRGTVTFGLRHFEQQLLRWRSIHDFGQRRGLHLSSLDLSVTNNVPARWLEAGEASMVRPPAARSGRSKKRNV